MTHSLWFDIPGGWGQVVGGDGEYGVTLTTTCPQSLEIHSSSHIWGQMVGQVQMELIVTNNHLIPATLHQ